MYVIYMYKIVAVTLLFNPTCAVRVPNALEESFSDTCDVDATGV